MKIDIIFISFLVAIVFIVGLMLGSSVKEIDVFVQYCSQYEMAYNSSLECWVNKEKTEIRKIEWKNK